MIKIIIFVKNKNIEKGIDIINKIIEKCNLSKNEQMWKKHPNESDIKADYFDGEINIRLLATDNYIYNRGCRYNIAYIDKDFTFNEVSESILPLGTRRIINEQYF